ncbi:MAG: class I SAM-dependent methyltransferase [Armatimonadota bacterium]
MRLELHAAPDLDALMGEVRDAEALPYWAVIWPAGEALARWVLARGGWAHLPVLELGCGTGIVGLAAAALGARVTLTDRFPEATVLARGNALRNGLNGVRCVAADWRAWPLRGRWPVVLAADVAYERALHAPLLRVLADSLAADGTAYLADPDRPMSADFFALAEREGWRVEVEPLASDSDLYLYRLRLPTR